MASVLKTALHSGLGLNGRALAIADNAFDWLFMRESLVKSGLTPHETIYEGDPMSLRFYPQPEMSEIEIGSGKTMPVSKKLAAMPLLLVPPLGVTTETFDLLPHRSLVRYMAARGFQTYMIDWGRPEKRHADLNFKDYASTMFGEAVSEVRRHSGVKEISLMGWCMGGLLSLMYLGLSRDPYVKNLVTVASPIDMRGGGKMAQVANSLNGPARFVRKFSRFRLHNLASSKLSSPGWATTLAFKLTDPIGSITTYWDLLTRLWDRDFVESYSTTADYLNNMLLYPGGVVQDMVVKMAVDNQMASGKIEVRGAVADLTSIKANFLAYAGDRDILVPAVIARRSLELVASEDKEFHVVSGGHMGVILGSKAVNEVWGPTADWLWQRSATVSTPASTATAARNLKALRRRRAAEDPTL